MSSGQTGSAYLPCGCIAVARCPPPPPPTPTYAPPVSLHLNQYGERDTYVVAFL